MKKLLFIINQDWYFCLHWMERAIAARKAGFDVTIAVPAGGKTDEIRKAGFHVIFTYLTRSGLTPLTELKALIHLYRLVRKISPDLIVNVTIKPNLYGTIIGRLMMIPVVNNVTGLGSIFSRSNISNRILKNFILYSFKFLAISNRIKFLFENPEDRNLFISKKTVDPKKTFLMPGSGVDIDKFCFEDSVRPDNCIIILFAARLLRDKGITTLIEASKILRRKEINFEIWIAGFFDEGNKNNIPERDLIKWDKMGLIKWLGKRDDMPELISSAQIVTLPTYYGEGIPRIIIEAASCGKPIVTTDTPGCRDFVDHEKNGLLIPPKDPIALAASLERLINDWNLRKKMGEYGRKKVCDFFSEEIVIQNTIKIYNEMVE